MLNKCSSSFQNSAQDPDLDLNDDMLDDCKSKIVVVRDKQIIQTWDTNANFSQAWSNAEQKAKEPAHEYMEKYLSAAIYLYTDTSVQPVETVLVTAHTRGSRLKEMSDSRFLYSSLSDAIQILKHSQVTCLTTHYGIESPLNLNISTRMIRFGTFMLGSKEWYSTRNASCFEVYTCFGADVTRYSALKQNSQVLVPPYEVFEITDVQTDARRCKVVYRLKSNLNCVYDRETDSLHPISASAAEGFWLTFSIICIVSLLLFLLFVIVKASEKSTKSRRFNVV